MDYGKIWKMRSVVGLLLFTIYIDTSAVTTLSKYSNCQIYWWVWKHNYYLCTVRVSCRVIYPFLAKRYVYTFLQDRSQILKFAGAKYIFKGKEQCFCYMFETNLPGHNAVWGGTKIFGGTAPQCPYVYGPAFLVKKYATHNVHQLLFTVGPGFSYLQNSAWLTVVTWIPA